MTATKDHCKALMDAADAVVLAARSVNFEPSAGDAVHARRLQRLASLAKELAAHLSIASVPPRRSVLSSSDLKVSVHTNLWHRDVRPASRDVREAAAELVPASVLSASREDQEHLAHMVDSFGDELDALRQTEGFGPSEAASLLQILSSR